MSRTMSIINSKNSIWDNIYVNSETTNRNPARRLLYCRPLDNLLRTLIGNTDGMDTYFSSHLTFSNWEVHNGDDSISFKANSTDMVVKNCKFYRGLGIAFGSIGQYKGQFETIERIKISNIELIRTRMAVCIAISQYLESAG